MIRDALFWHKENDRIRCRLCPHQCLVSEGKSGICSVRVNNGGMLQTENYGEITSMAVDPVEKKPLYHFKPGKNILSVGTFGCNLSCSFCQNYSIAHFRSEVSIYLPNSWQQVSLHLTKAGTLALHLPITNRLYGSSMFLIQQKA